MPSESWEQGQVVKQLKCQGYLCASIPNEGRRTAVGLAEAKRRGLTTGAPDLLVFTPPPLKPWTRGVAIEFKKKKGGKEDPDQLAFLAALTAIGWETCLAHGAAEALDFLAKLGYAVATYGPSPSGAPQDA